jgi:hypothetical protein
MKKYSKEVTIYFDSKRLLAHNPQTNRIYEREEIEEIMNLLQKTVDLYELKKDEEYFTVKEEGDFINALFAIERFSRYSDDCYDDEDFLYLISFENMYKIGKTTNIKNRISQIRSITGLDCKLEFHFKGLGLFEKSTLLKFAHLNITGEYFKKDQAIYDYFESIHDDIEYFNDENIQC